MAIKRRAVTRAYYNGRIIRRGDEVEVDEDFKATWLGDEPKPPRKPIREHVVNMTRDEAEAEEREARREPSAPPHVRLTRRAGPDNHPTRLTPAEKSGEKVKRVSQERDLAYTQYQDEEVLGTDDSVMPDDAALEHEADNADDEGAATPQTAVRTPAPVSRASAPAPARSGAAAPARPTRADVAARPSRADIASRPARAPRR